MDETIASGAQASARLKTAQNVQTIQSRSEDVGVTEAPPVKKRGVTKRSARSDSRKGCLLDGSQKAGSGAFLRARARRRGILA